MTYTLIVILLHSTLIFSFQEYSKGKESDVIKEHHAARKVYTYRSYRDMQIYHFSIPFHVSKASFNLTSNHTNGCLPHNITVYAQAGSFPAISPDNAKFPDNSWIERSPLYHSSLLSDLKPVFLSINAPQPGDWFLIAYVYDESDKITQDGLFPSCFAWLEIEAIYFISTSVQPIAPRLLYFSDHIEETYFEWKNISKSLTYSFWVPDNVWLGEIKIKNCFVSNLDSSTSVCPASLLLRPMALPLPGTYNLLIENCSYSEIIDECYLSFDPYVSSWHYLEIILPSNVTSVSLGIAVLLRVCDSESESSQFSVENELGHSYNVSEDFLAFSTRNKTDESFASLTASLLTAVDNSETETKYPYQEYTLNLTSSRSINWNSSYLFNFSFYPSKVFDNSSQGFVLYNDSSYFIDKDNLTSHSGHAGFNSYNQPTSSYIEESNRSPSMFGINLKQFAEIPLKILTRINPIREKRSRLNPSNPLGFARHLPLITQRNTSYPATNPDNSIMVDFASYHNLVNKSSILVKDNSSLVPPLISERDGSLRMAKWNNSFCWPSYRLSKKTFAANFMYEFDVNPGLNGSAPLILNLSNDAPTLLSFRVNPINDIGGSLIVGYSISPFVNVSTHNYSVISCLSYAARPKLLSSEEGLTCSRGYSGQVNTTGRKLTTSSVLVPYPEPGLWFLLLYPSCFLQNMSEEINCDFSFTPVIFSIGSSSCVAGKCGNFGSCFQYISGGFLFSTCVCSVGYQGYGCTDGSHAISNSKLLLSTLFLCLSNLFFLPAIVLATYRRFYTEALIYFFTMFFSTFYHACDQTLFTFCLMPLGVLQFCDFYSAILSFWVTLIVMADLPPSLYSILHMTGAIVVALGVEYNRRGIWVFAIPSISAFIIMTIAWAVHSRKQKRCYPPRRYWLKSLIPGVTLAAIGLVCYAFFETEQNYFVVHSLWHSIMALSILCLLPSAKEITPKDVSPTQENEIHTSENQSLTINLNI